MEVFKDYTKNQKAFFQRMSYNEVCEFVNRFSKLATSLRETSTAFVPSYHKQEFIDLKTRLSEMCFAFQDLLFRTNKEVHDVTFENLDL